MRSQGCTPADRMRTCAAGSFERCARRSQTLRAHSQLPATRGRAGGPKCGRGQSSGRASTRIAARVLGARACRGSPHRRRPRNHSVACLMPASSATQTSHASGGTAEPEPQGCRARGPTKCYVSGPHPRATRGTGLQRKSLSRVHRCPWGSGLHSQPLAARFGAIPSAARNTLRHPTSKGGRSLISRMRGKPQHPTNMDCDLMGLQPPGVCSDGGTTATTTTATDADQ